MSADAAPRGGSTAPEIADAAERLHNGELVAFPTETVYGLGADARNPAALRRVFALKQRPRSHPLIVHLLSVEQLRNWVAAWPSAAAALASAFWPGPLTLVLPRAPAVPDLVTGGQDTVAVRVPSHPVARALLAAFGGGIAAPSANRYGHVSPTCAQHVRDEFGAELACVLDGGDCEWGLESAIVACLAGPPRLLRPGSIGADRLRAVVPGLEQGADAASPRVSGSTLAHYSPGTPLRLVPAARLAERAAAIVAARGSVAVLARAPNPQALAGVHWQAGGESPEAFAHGLYAALRALDRLGCGAILVEAPPPAADWDAVRDRLQRAAAGTPPDEDELAAGGLP